MPTSQTCPLHTRKNSPKQVENEAHTSRFTLNAQCEKATNDGTARRCPQANVNQLITNLFLQWVWYSWFDEKFTSQRLRIPKLVKRTRTEKSTRIMQQINQVCNFARHEEENLRPGTADQVVFCHRWQTRNRDQMQQNETKSQNHQTRNAWKDSLSKPIEATLQQQTQN